MFANNVVGVGIVILGILVGAVAILDPVAKLLHRILIYLNNLLNGPFPQPLPGPKNQSEK